VEEESFDKKAGYATFYETLLVLTKLLAPFVPFISEKIFRSLNGGESVHLCDYPVLNEDLIDRELEKKMEKVRQIAEGARSLRAKRCIKLRYPLAKAILVTKDDLSQFIPLLKDEMNVKDIEFSESSIQFLEKKVKAHYSALGPKFKEKAEYVASVIEKTPVENIKTLRISIDGTEYDIGAEDYRIEEHEKEGYAIMSLHDDVLVLLTERTPELLAEGFSRELVRRVQEMRKKMDLNMLEKIITSVDCDRSRVKGWEEHLKKETRSSTLHFGEKKGEVLEEWDIDGEKICIGISRFPQNKAL
jgi:isoleucyl-tRNA synthetase